MRRRVVLGSVGGVALLGVLAVVLALAGVGSTTTENGAAPAIATRGPASYGGVGGGSAASKPEIGTDDVAREAGGVVAAPAPAPDVAPDAPGAKAAPAVPPPDTPLPSTVGRDVVRTAQLTVAVSDPTAAARGVRTAVAAAGGFVAEEQADTTGSWLVLKVPVAALDRLVDDLAKTGTVLARSARTEDATDQIVDLDSRVASQQASVTRVRALLAQATSIGDIVAVESELAHREADLDSLERRRAALRDQVALSTLTVELRGAADTPTPVGPPPGFGSGLGAGWAGLKVIGAALATAAGFLLPFLPVLAVGGAVGWLVVRRRRARRGRSVPAPAAAP